MPNTDGYSSPVDFRITQSPQPVKDYSSKYNFEELYDFAFQVISTFVRYLGVGTYDQSLWPNLALDPGQLIYEGNLNKIYVIAKVNVLAGHYMNLFNDAGVLKIQPANAAPTTLWADGYITADIAAGAVGEFIMSRGNNQALTGLTIGQRYWLDGSGTGGIRTTPPVAAGTLEQYLGIAVTATELITNIMYPIQH